MPLDIEMPSEIKMPPFVTFKFIIAQRVQRTRNKLFEMIHNKANLPNLRATAC